MDNLATSEKLTGPAGIQQVIRRAQDFLTAGTYQKPPEGEPVHGVYTFEMLVASALEIINKTFPAQRAG